MSGHPAGAWDFIVRRHGEPGVEAACLALQDAHGQCVALLMWRVWTLAAGIDVSDDDLARAVETARAWDGAVITPLRAVRRRLATPLPGLDDTAGRRLREGVLDQELAAERVLIETLARFTTDGVAREPTQDVAALAQAVGVWGGTAPDDLLAKLTGAC